MNISSERSKRGLNDLLSVLGPYVYQCSTDDGQQFAAGETHRSGWVYLLPNLTERDIRVEVVGLRLQSGNGVTMRPCDSLQPWHGAGALRQEDGALLLEYESASGPERGRVRDRFEFERWGVDSPIKGRFEHEKSDQSLVQGTVSLRPLSEIHEVRAAFGDMDPLFRRTLPIEVIGRAGELIMKDILEREQIPENADYLLVDAILGGSIFTREGEDGREVAKARQGNPYAVFYGRRLKSEPVRVR